MGKANNSLRIRTDIGGDAYITVNLDQDYETLDILSIKIDQRGAYRYHVSDYGVVVGRVLANNGFGVPNARLSLFIEKNNTIDVIKEMLYPYESTMTKNGDGIRYNLLPDKKRDDCHQVVGTFPNKRVVLDDNNMLEIFDEYYKYTTRTNESGDYMFFGIPTGSYTLHMDLDISDCGKLSQRPRDFVYKGYTIEQFENPNQFKIDTELSTLAQIFTQDTTIEVKPFWGDANEGSQIGITRKDIDVAFKFEPTCVFMGSIVTDNPNEGISTKCVPSNRMGEMSSLITGPGTIEIIRKKVDNTIEELQIKGTQLINGNGVWCFQIPMNLDYVMTDEYGNMVPTDNPEKGIPTRCEVRFRLSLDEANPDAVNYHRGKVLVPHNPKTEVDLDYNFGSKTKDKSFKSLMWNNVYTIKSFIPRFQKARNVNTDKFSGIKKINSHGHNSPMPYNNIRIKIPFMFWLLCNIIKLFIRIIGFLNSMKKTVMSVVGNLADITLPYSYISNEICPDLENWYFAPKIPTSPKTKKNNRTCRQWQNQSVCETFKEIGSTLSPSSANQNFYKLNVNNKIFKGEYENIPNLIGEIVKVNLSGVSEDTNVVAYERKDDNLTAIPLNLFITEDEYKNLGNDTDTEGKEKQYYIKFYSGVKIDPVNTGDIIDMEFYAKSGETETFELSDLYTTTTPSEVQKYASQDKTSADVINALDNQDVRINLTNNTDYLMQCVEMNLAQEYDVIKFDFYNDWINGCVYLPRWARDVKYKKRRKNGQRIITERVKGCINNVSKSRISRRYVQQCSLSYDDSGQVTTHIGCHSNNKLRCHKKAGMTAIQVMGGKSGVVNESKTSLGHNVYYLKPCEFQSTRRVPFFATDIVMLGTLLDCNEFGLPSTFESLVSTTYQMPPQMALTNVDDDIEQYFDLSSSSPTPAEVSGWACNSKCNKGGKMVVGRINENGVVKQTPSYSDLDAIIAEKEKETTEKEKWFKIWDVDKEDVKDSEGNLTGEEVIKNVDVYHGPAENLKLILTGATGTVLSFPAYDDDGNRIDTYYVGETEFTINENTKWQTYYKVKESGEVTLDFEDMFPITEMSGIEWGYQGVGYSNKDSDDKLFAPGGHFMGLSCANAQTNIRSCVNLQRACEIGTSLSTRFDVPMGFSDKEDEGDLSFDVVNYLYVAPNGLISKDQITDVNFRSAFATMNQNSLKTRENEYGYKGYDFTYLLPDSFDGSLNNKISEHGANIAYNSKQDQDAEKYWGEYFKEHLEPKLSGSSIGTEYEIQQGFTITRSREDERSDDYVTFRLGGKPSYLNGSTMPVYENSFYFYFGLKDGASALDEFKTQFYAPCAKNVIVEEKGTMTITQNPSNGSDYKSKFIFDLDVKVRGLEPPFTYNLEYLDRGSLVQFDSEGKTRENYKGATSRYSIQADTLDFEIKGVTVGEYTLYLQDLRGNEVSQTFNVGKDYLKVDYDKSTLQNYTTLFSGVTKITEIGNNPIIKGIGGCIDGTFKFVNKNVNGVEVVIKRVLTEDGEVPWGEDVDVYPDNFLDWEIIAYTTWDTISYWEKRYLSKRFYFWAPGKYEIWLRVYKEEGFDLGEAIEYKYDEFTVYNGAEYGMSLMSDYGGTDDDTLYDLEMQYGKWWVRQPFGTGSTINNGMDFFPLYRAVVEYTSDTSLNFNIKIEGGDIELWNKEGGEENISSSVEPSEGDYNNLWYCAVRGNSPDSWSMFCEGNIRDGVLTANGSTTKTYSQFIEYINKQNNVDMRRFGWQLGSSNPQIVNCTLSDGKIVVTDMNNGLIDNGDGRLFYLTKLPYLRNVFKYQFVYMIYNGNTSTNVSTYKFLDNSVTCFENSLTLHDYGDGKNAVTFAISESAIPAANRKTDPYGNHKFIISAETGNFADGAVYEGGKFIAKREDIDGGTEVNDNIFEKRYFVVDRNTVVNQNYNVIWNEFDRGSSESTVVSSTSTNKAFIEGIRYREDGIDTQYLNPEKTIDGKNEQVMLINVLYF